MADAACLGQGDLMFDGRRVAEAKALCHQCPVLDDCRKMLEADPEFWIAGVIAGTAPSDRMVWVTVDDDEPKPEHPVGLCQTCGDPLERKGAGRPPKYCGRRCYERSRPKRKRVPAHA